uniref:T1SS-143 repeat domain-containing protein n=1 Tax=Pseudoalteromonas sp. RB2-MNA-CIBAN-0110 TaxID=3140439 RepID=UPI0033204E57
ITGTTTGVEDDQKVTVVVKDAAGNERSFEATVTNNAYTITGADVSGLNDGTLTATATVSDVAGNTATDTDTAIHDKTAVTSIDVATGDDAVINTAEQNNVVVSGVIDEADENQTATVIFTDVNGKEVTVENVAIDADGQWRVDAADITGLADGEITASVSALDVEGNLATSSTTFTKDATINIDIDTGDNGINSKAFKAGEVTTINGTTDAEDTSTVTLTIFDGTNSEVVTATVTDGAWSVNGIDVSALDDSQQWTIVAAVTDSAGNTAQDSTPILDALDSQTLNESNTGNGGTSSATSSIEIDNADLTLSENQSGLEGLKVNGDAVTVTLATDGLSLQVKDSQGNLVLSVALAGGELTTTLHAPIDHESESLLTDIFVDALQTDADGTTELVVVPTAVTITDSAPQSSDDSFTVTEADTDAGRVSTGSLVTNDSVVEGAPTVTSVTFNGTDYDVTTSKPATIVTDEGTLTVNSDGTWSFNAVENQDSDPEPEFTIEYTIADRDGVGSSTSKATFTVQDGSAASFINQTATYTESDYGVTTTNNKSFAVVAGSDALVADSITFDDTITNLNALNLTSAGEAITFALSADGKTITGSTNSSEVIRFSVSATQDANGKDLDTTVQTVMSLPIDNPSGNRVNFALSLNGEDSDGTAIGGAGNVIIRINDGGTPEVADTTATPINIDESGLDPSNNVSVTQQGTVSTTLGSDSLKSLTFSTDSQPKLTAGGVALVYTLSDDGLTITANTGDGTETIFIATLPVIDGTASQNLTYDFTLYRPFDNDTGGTAVPLQVDVQDTDGDSDTATLNITVKDGGAEHTQNNIDLTVSETPNSVADSNEDGDNQANTDTDNTFKVTAGLDDVVDMQVGITNGTAVLDSGGNQLTQTTLDKDGNKVTTNIVWLIGSDGTAQGILEGTSTEVFKITLPDVNVAAQTSETYSISFEITGAIDHTGVTTDAPQIVIPVYTKDTDGSQVTSNVTVTLNDGTDPAIADSAASVDEASLRGNDSITTTGQITVTQGSDEVVEIKLADDFITTFNNEGYVTADGNNAITLGDKNGNDWYIAKANGEEVFRIKFNPDGSYTYKQSVAIEHPDADGTNTQDISFDVTAVDADGDTNNAAVTIKVTDDTPTVDTTPVAVNLVEGGGKTLELLDITSSNFVGNTNNPGADGAKLASFIYGGTTYTAFDSGSDSTGNYKEVAFKGESNGDTSGTLRVYESGKVVITTDEFAQSADEDFTDSISYTVIDNDGDAATGSIDLTISDYKGELTVTATDINEDAIDGSGNANNARSEVTITIDRGDITDQDETVSEIKIEVASLQGGELYLNGNLATDSADVTIVDGYYVFTGAALTTNADETVTVANLTFQSAENSSDFSNTVEFKVETTITIKNGGTPRELNDSTTISVESVADAPEWNAGNTYEYTLDEDSPENLTISAALTDTDGSEKLTYVISGLDDNLVLKIGGRTITEGSILTQSELNNLTVSNKLHATGEYTFDIQATSTEKDNNSTATADKQTVTVTIDPVADAPKLAVRVDTINEDSNPQLSDLINGQLVDTDGSERLKYEIEIPTFTDANGNDQVVKLLDGNGDEVAPVDGVYTIFDTDLANYTLKLPEHLAQEEIALKVNAISEEVVDGNVVSSAETGVKEFTFKVVGVADSPVLKSNNDWAYDDTGLTLTNTTGVEDELLTLDFLFESEDTDGSETVSLVISELPDGVTLVNATTGEPANLPVVGIGANGNPKYSLLASEAGNYALKPSADFSGNVDFNITVVTTEPDTGEFNTKDTEIKASVTFTPVIDSTNLNTNVVGNEDSQISLKLNPELSDIDGSESITKAIINSIPDGTTLYINGIETAVGSGLDVTDYLNTDSVTLKPDEDYSGELSVGITYTVQDTSAAVSSDINANIAVTVNGKVDVASSIEADGAVTRIETTNETITNEGSGNERQINLTGVASFIEEDIDGSEHITYIEIILPENSSLKVIYMQDGKNIASPDGTGRWVIPIDAGTSDAGTSDAINDLLNNVIIEANSSTGSDVDVTVNARVKDGDDSALVSGNFKVRFNIDGEGETTTASPVNKLQIENVTADEGGSVTFEASDFNLGEDLSQDADDNYNDVITIYVEQSSLPEGFTIEGDGIIAVETDTGIEYIIPESSLSTMVINSNDSDYSGLLEIPVKIVAVDPSGDREIDENQSLRVDINPVVDGGTLTAATQAISEDNTNTSLGITFTSTDESTSSQDGGIEEIDFTQAITIELPDGGTLYDPSGNFELQTDGSYLYKGDGSTFDADLAGVGINPPENAKGDFDINISATIVDRATLSTGEVKASSTINQTITVNVTPVTDGVTLTANSVTGNEDSEIILTGLAATSRDDSETTYFTISGVPKGATLIDAVTGEELQIINNGDDGSENGTTSWTIPRSLLEGNADNIVLLPPLDFSGDITLSLNAISQDGTQGELLQQSQNFIVSVNPVADRLDFSQKPEDNYSGDEDSNVTIDLAAFSTEADGTEQVQLKVIINGDSDESALAGLENGYIELADGTKVNFAKEGNNYIATVTSEEGSGIENFDFNAGGLAFGTFNMSVEVATMDSAVINGETVTVTGTPETSDFIVELEPQADAPLWTAAEDVTSNSTNNIALNLDVDLQNPAADETGFIEITGLPDGYNFNFGEKVGGTWTVNINDIESLEIVNADAGDSFDLTLTAFSTLNGETQAASPEEINVTISESATTSSARTASASGDSAPDYGDMSGSGNTAHDETIASMTSGDQN